MRPLHEEGQYLEVGRACMSEGMDEVDEVPCCHHERIWEEGQYIRPMLGHVLMLACVLTQVDVGQEEAHQEHLDYKLYLVQEWCNVRVLRPLALHCCCIPYRCDALRNRSGARAFTWGRMGIGS